MAYGSHTTANNIAENLGLLRGLKACLYYGWTLGHVIGDSHLSQWIADQLPVMSWRHYYREYNKMADKLANMTMDACSSVQVLLSCDSGSGEKCLDTQLMTLAID
ncbi:hypothetical protein PI124_g19359 [Phytophthora idaei]|nr:hypothetical protein PI125_g20985 [Phytophthora idaei]KAG3133114.1 hypothetical protein PI126_g19310 [Phytophthora idaei]KAG3235607.1 hypothetical protein PI124_g19359 [Phytophthora idaei]